MSERWIFAYVAFAACLVIATFAPWQFTPDDTYIFLRYAENAFEWNPGEGAVDGSSSMLWTLIVRVLPDIDAVKAVSYTLVLVTVVMLAFFEPYVGLCMLLFPYAWVVGVSGMDTAITALLLTLLTIDKDENRLTVWMMLATISRPEAPLAIVVIYALRGRSIIPVLAVFGASLVVRAFVFGESLYAPVRVKAADYENYMDIWRYAFPIIPSALIFLFRLFDGNHLKGAMTALIAYSLLRATSGSWEESLTYAEGLENAHARVASQISWTDTLAISDAGLVPYVSKAYTIDMLGLNTPAIANGVPASELVYLYQPTVAVLISKDSVTFDPMFRHERDVYYMNGWNWVREKTYRFNDHYWLQLYRRAGHERRAVCQIFRQGRSA